VIQSSRNLAARIMGEILADTSAAPPTREEWARLRGLAQKWREALNQEIVPESDPEGGHQ